MEIGKLGDRVSGFTQYIAQSASKTLSISYTKDTKADPNDAFYKAINLCKAANSKSSIGFEERIKGNASIYESESIIKGPKKEISLKTVERKNFPKELKEKELQAICYTYFIVAEND